MLIYVLFVFVHQMCHSVENENYPSCHLGPGPEDFPVYEMFDIRKVKNRT